MVSVGDEYRLCIQEHDDKNNFAWSDSFTIGNVKTFDECVTAVNCECEVQQGQRAKICIATS